MQQKKHVYVLLGAALVLVIAGILYLIFVDRAVESLSAEKQPGQETKDNEPAPFKPDLSALKKRQALVKKAVGQNPELTQLAEAIENRGFKEETRVALVETLALNQKQPEALAQMLRLLGRLKTTADDAAARETLIYSLGRFIGHERARFKLIECLSPPTVKGERLQAMSAIRAHSANWSQSHLEPIAASDPDDEIREQARRTLAAIAKRSMRKR